MGERAKLATRMIAGWQLACWDLDHPPPEKVSVDLLFWVVAGYELEKKQMAKDVTMRRFDPDYKKKKEKKKSRAQERRVAKKVGGKRRPLSGAHEKAKGDLADDVRLFEAKRTAKKSLRIEAAWLEKISIEAFAESREPGFTFSFDEVKMSDLAPKDWVAISAEAYQRLKEAAGQGQ